MVKSHIYEELAEVTGVDFKKRIKWLCINTEWFERENKDCADEILTTIYHDINLWEPLRDIMKKYRRQYHF